MGYRGVSACSTSSPGRVRWESCWVSWFYCRSSVCAVVMVVE